MLLRGRVDSRDIKTTLEGSSDTISVYHGSNMAVQTPILSRGRAETDFGQGFYVTNDMSVARRSAQKRVSNTGDGAPTISTYSFRLKEALSVLDLNVQVFWQPTCPWADFIVSNRRRKAIRPSNRPDLVIGPIADLHLYKLIENCNKGIVSQDDVVSMLEGKILGTEDTFQIAFRSRRSLSFLEYTGSILV